MHWNHSEQRPYFLANYHMPQIMTKEEIDHFVINLVEDYYGDSDVDIINLQISKIQNLFNNVGYSVERFMLNHTWKCIESAKIRFRLIDEFIFRSFRELGILDYVDYCQKVAFLKRNGKNDEFIEYIKELSPEDFDNLARLYFCQTESDVWDMYAEGIGSVHDMANFYDDQEKNLSFLRYIYNRGNHSDEVIWALEVNLGMIDYDEFFEKGNMDKIQRAWETGIMEIREKFVHTESSLQRLKEILDKSNDE